MRVAAGSSCLTVQSHGRLVDKVGQTALQMLGKRCNQSPTFRLMKTFRDLDAGILQASDPFAGNLRIGVNNSYVDPGDTGIDNRFRTRTGTAGVTAGFKGHVEFCPRASVPAFLSAKISAWGSPAAG